MCFYVDSKYPNKQIAKRDIICYKVLWNDYKSTFQSKLYKLNKLYKVRIEKPYFCNDTYSIDRGFHSYSSLKKAVRERVYTVNLADYSSGYSKKFALKEFVIVKCMIPKDSEYYYNSKEKEYVSNQIVIKEKIK